MFDADPHAVAAAHRASSAALYDHGQQARLVLRHVDVTAMLRDPNLKKDPAAASDGPYTRALLADDHSMLVKDDPDHRRLRSLVSQAISKRATEPVPTPQAC
jgi:cytochrome P450